MNKDKQRNAKQLMKSKALLLTIGSWLHLIGEPIRYDKIDYIFFEIE